MKLPYSLFTRRSFLNGLLGGGLAALAAAFIGPLMKFVIPPTREPDEVSLPLADFGDLSAGAVRSFAWGNKPGLLKKSGDGSFIAFVGVCTHLDCNVTFLAAEKRFYCACHEGWFDENGINIAGPPPSPLRDVLLKRIRLEDAISALSDADARQLAYEVALGGCEADGRMSGPERAFLERLRSALALDAASASEVEGEAEAMAGLADDAAPASLPAAAAGPVVAAQPSVPEAELDKSILNYALLNGALELLPQSWASMAIIPLQIKMVYGIGKAYGVTLDQGHIKEFIAAAGVGQTSQSLEQFGRKLLGGLLGKAAGKTAGKIGSAATGMAVSFATTYALGQLAKRYYAGGRTMSTAMLKETFQNLLGPAREMQARYLPQIRQQAGTLDMGRVMAMVRGS